MPAHLKEIGGKTLRVALPVAALGSLCSVALNEQTPGSAPEASPANTEISADKAMLYGQQIMLVDIHTGNDPLVLNRSSWPPGSLETFHPKPKPAKQPVHMASQSFPDTYTVQSGDSFSSIAEKLHFSIHGWNFFNIVRDNGLEPWSLLSSGEVLKTPRPGEAPAAPELLAPPSSSIPVPATKTVAATPQVGTVSAASTTSLNSSMWRCIRNAESNDQYNNPAKPSGAYGILLSTWAAMPGMGFGEAANYATPAAAPPYVQDQAALFLYAKNNYKFGGTWNDPCTGT